MTTIVAVVGGPLLIALVDLLRRRNSRLELTARGFPKLPVGAIPGGRSLLSEPVADVSVAAEVAPKLEETASMPKPVSNASPWTGTVENVPRGSCVPSPMLPLATSVPTPRPSARFLPHAQPRGFAIQAQ
jgi:hypothetical protein